MERQQNAFISQRDLEVVSNCLQSARNPVVLVAGGSFNPVHTEHIAMMETAKTYLLSSGVNVVVGFLNISTDDYLLQAKKLGGEAMKFHHRKEMCRIAVGNTDWLCVCGLPEKSPRKAGKNIKKHIQQTLGKKVQVMTVWGADTALRMKLFSRGQPTDAVIVGRPGENLQQHIATVRKRLGPKKQGRLDEMHVVEGKTKAVSSTAIRKIIQDQAFDRLQAFCCTEVVQYICQNQSALWIYGSAVAPYKYVDEPKLKLIAKGRPLKPVKVDKRRLQGLILIGVGGASRAGKTTISKTLQRTLGAELIHGDYFKRREGRPRMRLGKKEFQNCEVPEAWDWNAVYKKLTQLATGERKVVIFESFLAFSQPWLRELFEVSIFVSVPKPILKERRCRTAEKFLYSPVYFEQCIWPAYEKYGQPPDCAFVLDGTLAPHVIAQQAFDFINMHDF